MDVGISRVLGVFDVTFLKWTFSIMGKRLTFPKPSLIWPAFSKVSTDLNIRSFGRVKRRERLGEVIPSTAMRRYCLNVHMHLWDVGWDIMTSSGVVDNDLIDTRFKTQNVISFEPYLFNFFLYLSPYFLSQFLRN